MNKYITTECVRTTGRYRQMDGWMVEGRDVMRARTTVK